MITLDYSNSVFKIEFKYGLDQNDIFEVKQLLQSIYVFWDKTHKKYIIKENRIDELLLWCVKYDFQIDFTDTAKIKYEEFQSSYYERETKFFRSHKFDESLLTKTTKLYDFQREDINWAVKRNRIYLGSDPGTGKSLQTICTLSQWYHLGLIDSVILIVRNGLSYHWIHEFLEFALLFKEDEFQIVENSNKHNIFDEYRDKKILVIPNHLFADTVLSYKKDKIKKKSSLRYNSPFVNIQKAWNKKSIGLVIDEAHDYKHSSSVRFQALNAHIDFFDFRIFCSATPAINKFDNYWSQMSILDKAIIPMSENAFKISIAKEIGNEYSMYNIKQYDQRAIRNIKSNFQYNLIKRLKKDLPEMKTEQVIKPIYFQMHRYQKDLYFKIYKELLEKIEKERDENGHLRIRNIEQKFSYAIQAIDNPLLLEGKLENEEINKLIKKCKFDNDPRIQYLDSHLEEVIGELDEKVIVFDTHPLTLNLLKERYKKYHPLIIHGALDLGKESKEAYRYTVQGLFNDKKSRHKLILLSSLTSSAGINLQKACHRIVVFTQGADSVAFRQLIDRTHRINSEEDTIVTIFVFDKSWDLIRLERNLNRTQFNDEYFNKALSENEIDILINGKLNKKTSAAMNGY